MKLIIAGSRTINLGANAIDIFLRHFKLSPKEIVSGGALGVDKSGEEFSKLVSYVNLVKFPADWNTHGKSAGPIRNRQMADYSDSLLLIWDGQSRGSKNMKREMEKLGKPIYEVILK